MLGVQVEDWVSLTALMDFTQPPCSEPTASGPGLQVLAVAHWVTPSLAFCFPNFGWHLLWLSPFGFSFFSLGSFLSF